MRGNRDKVSTIRQLLAEGQYQIDPHATAEALMRRIGMWPLEFDALAADCSGPASNPEPQSECSYPDRFWLLSRNSMPAGPSATEPIRVRPAFAAGEV
jgi:hypothetical protein